MSAHTRQQSRSLVCHSPLDYTRIHIDCCVCVFCFFLLLWLLLLLLTVIIRFCSAFSLVYRCIEFKFIIPMYRVFCSFCLSLSILLGIFDHISNFIHRHISLINPTRYKNVWRRSLAEYVFGCVRVCGYVYEVQESEKKHHTIYCVHVCVIVCAFKIINIHTFNRIVTNTLFLLCVDSVVAWI